MAQPQLAIKIIANTAELIANLNAGRGAIESYGPSVAKMQESWKLHGAKVVEQAALITAGLKGVALGTLTAGDAAKNLKALEAGMAQLRQTGQPIPAQMQATATALRDLSPPTQNWKTQLLGLAGALGLAFSATAIISGIKRMITSTLDYADSLSNLKLKTDISVAGLQRLESIGKPASVSMETLAGSVTMLHMRLNDPAAIRAIEKMGLNYQSIRTMEPERQFFAIATALAAIQDPVTRANTGVALFGRGWAEIMPAIRGDLQRLIDGSAAMSDAQVAALDRAGDAWDTWTLNRSRSIRAFLGDMVIADQVFQEATWFWQLPRTMPIIPDDSAILLRVADGITDVSLSDAEYARVIQESDKAVAKHQAAIQKAADEFDKMSAAVNGSQFAWQRALDLQHLMAGFLPILESRVYAVNASMMPTLGILPTLSSTTYTATTKFTGLQGALDSTNRTFDVVRESLGTGLDALSTSFANLGAIGGDSLNAVTRGIGSVVSGLSVALAGVDSFKGGLKSMKSGDYLHGIAGIASGIGGIVGAAQVAIGAVKALWSWAKGGEEGQHVNPAREAWFTLQGGLETLNPKIMAVTGSLKLVQDVFDARTVVAYEAAIAAVTAALDKQAGVAETLVDAVEQLPRHVPAPWQDWPAPPHVPDYGGGPDWGGEQAHGGDYLVTRPTLFLAGEAGRERATFTPQGSMSGGGVSNAGMETELRDIKRLLRDQPRAMEVALKDAMTLVRRAA